MYTVYSSVKEIGRGGAHHETTEGKSEEIRAEKRKDQKNPAADHDYEPRDCDDMKQDRPHGSQTTSKGTAIFSTHSIPERKIRKLPSRS